MKALEEAIVAPSPNHEDIKLVKHARSKAFAVASIPDYMGDCSGLRGPNTRRTGEFQTVRGEKNYGKYYATGFRLAKTGEIPACSGLYGLRKVRHGS